MAEPSGPRGVVRRRPPPVDELLDGFLPHELDWQRLVRTYPIASVTLAAAGGFLLGRARGREILSALSDYASDLVAETVNDFLGKDVL